MKAKVYYDKSLLREALIANDWNMVRTADAIGCNDGTVRKWFRLWELDKERPYTTEEMKARARRAPVPGEQTDRYETFTNTRYDQGNVPIGTPERSPQGSQPGIRNDPNPPHATPWGLGGPVHLPPPLGVEQETVVYLADLHGGHREQGCLDAALSVIRDVKPDTVVFLGDTFNFDIISQWQKAKLAKMTVLEWQRAIRHEIEDVHHNIFGPVLAAAGSARLLKVEGNHDDRLRKFLTDDLEEGWRVAREMLGVDQYGIRYVNRAGFYLRDDYLVRHGATTSQNPAKKEYSDTHCGGASGHLHKVHDWWEPFPQVGKLMRHTCLPAMCRLDANYGTGNAGLMRWVQGIGVGSHSVADPYDYTVDIGVWNAKARHLRLRGQLYR